METEKVNVALTISNFKVSKLKNLTLNSLSNILSY